MAKAARLVELQAVMKEIKPEIDSLKADLLKITQELDVLTLKTGNYTISRARRITPRVTDFKTLKEQLEDAHIPYQTVEAFSKNMEPVFKKMIEDKTVIEGLEGTETEYISIRLAKKEEHGNI